LLKAEEAARRSGLAREENELDRINDRYDELKRRAQELKLGEGVQRRIEAARDIEGGNFRQREAVEEYKKFIAEQRELFTQFEEYKKQVGEEKARELTQYQTAEYNNVIEFLKVQLALVSQDQSLKGKLKREFLISAITAEEKAQTRRDVDEEIENLRRVIDATITFNDRRRAIEEQFQKDLVSLRKLYAGKDLEEREKLLRQSRDEELAELENSIVRQSALYKQLNEDIIRYSRAQIKQKVEDLKRLLEADLTLTPQMKADIQAYIKSMERLLHDTSKGAQISRDFQKIAADIAIIGGSLGTLADSVEDTNKDLADTLRTLSDVADVAASAATAIAQFAAGDYVGAIASAVQTVSKLFSFGRRAREESRRYQQELQEFNTRVFIGEQEINLLYQERTREQIRLNKLRLQGLQDEKQLLLEQKQVIKSQFDLVLAELQKQNAKVLKTITVFGSISFDVLTEESLLGKTYEELEQLFLKGQLEGKARELFEILQKIKEQGEDIDKLLEDNANSVREILTGTTADSITDSIVEGFRNGLRSASDFADNFEELMTNAVLQALKYQTLEAPLKEFYNQFAADAESDGILTEEEIRRLRDNFNAIIENAGKRFQELQDITNMDLTATATGNNKTLSGAIKGITEQQADLLAGQFGGLRLTALDHLKVAQSQLSALQAIQNHTSNLVSIYQLLQRIELQGLKVK
jgi:hypothetical protein